ncbi:HD family phosphohydrolase [Marinicrinis lubricantis]|uniref:HD family phosphohydrolase n=1 Tax=Marinicrinis lubricantis TaxID=2086470 RepID=A0ABW1IUR4_9BACL
MIAKTSSNTSSKAKWSIKMQGWQQNRMVRAVFYILLIIFFYVTLANPVIPPTYNIQEGTRSESDILAPRQLLDTEATDKAMKEAVAKVQDVYTTIPVRSTDLIESIYDKLETINGDEQFTSAEKVKIFQSFFPSEFNVFVNRTIVNVSDRPQLKAEAEKEIIEQQYRLPEEVYFKLPRASVDQIADMENVTKDIVSKLASDALLDATAARSKVAELVNASDLSSTTAREIVQEISRFVMIPNRFYDEQATREAEEEAKASVEPIYYQKNDVLVKAGEVITPEKYKQLSDLGLTNAEDNFWSELGLLFIVLLFVAAIYMFNRQSKLPISTNNNQLLMLTLIYIITLVCMKIVHMGQNLEYPYIGFLAPVALGSMLISVLLDHRLAFVSVLIMSIVSSMMYNQDSGQAIFDFRFGLVSAVVGLVSVFAINKASQRSIILRAGLLVSLFSIIAITALLLLHNDYTTKDVIMSYVFGGASGLLTAVLVIGLLPFFEVTFGILSPLRLVELSNPNHPLLRKLLTETPGTYHHSVMVGNLSEAAAEAIGANGLLCRVGSFYHDIGKTKRPSYFIENQGSMQNPHDQIEPSLSKSIIVAHARDGVEMLEEYKIPKQICDIAGQHHGTTLLKYFYHKAIKMQEELPEEEREEIKEEDYRYPGPKAQSKEAAVVGIADCIEAAVRSLRNPTIEHIDSMVDKIIKDRLEDGQFNECDLTLKELDTIGKSLKESLLGIFHSRIEYPEMPDKSKAKGEHAS